MHRFISQYKLNYDEIKLFKGKYLDIDLKLLYYQKKFKNVYNIFYSSDNEKVFKLIKKILKKYF